MKKRIFYFDGSQGAAEAMLQVLKHYADVAYPLGGSDCAAASREALQTIMAKIQQAESKGVDAEISRRQRPLLKAALNWFYAESKSDAEYANDQDVMYNRLLSQFQKT